MSRKDSIANSKMLDQFFCIFLLISAPKSLLCKDFSYIDGIHKIFTSVYLFAKVRKDSKLKLENYPHLHTYIQAL